jgi:hypothetical protein
MDLKGRLVNWEHFIVDSVERTRGNVSECINGGLFWGYASYWFILMSVLMAVCFGVSLPIGLFLMCEPLSSPPPPFNRREYRPQVCLP